MKKRIAVILTALCAVLMLTGCVRMKYGITIHPNGKMDMQVLLACNDRFKAVYGTPDDSWMDEYLEDRDEYEAVPYEEDGYKGYIFTKKDVEPDEAELGEDDEELFRKSGGYYEFEYPLTGFDSEEDYDLGMFMSAIEEQDGYLQVEITFPKAPVAHNATSVSADGCTLTWDLLSDRCPDTAYAKFSMGIFRPVTLVLIGAGVLVYLVILFLVIRKVRKKKTDRSPLPAPEELPLTETGPGTEARDDAVDTFR